MSWLSKISLKNGAAVIILCAVVMGYGLFSATQIKQQTFPDLEFPAVFIQAVYPGASTEEVEGEVTTPVESSLMGMKGYDSLTSTSFENGASIFLQYPFGSNMDEINTNVQAAIAKLKLPSRAEVSVQRLSINSQPIYVAAISSNKDNAKAMQSKLENDVAPKLRKLEGVNSVMLGGTDLEEIQIHVDKEKASQHGISLNAIQTAIQSLDYALPLGAVTQDETAIPIRLVGSINSLQKIEELKLSSGIPADPAVSNQVKLSDIAEISTMASQKEITRFNGKQSFTISVMKDQDANTADVANLVKDTLSKYVEAGEIDIRVIADHGAEIEHSVSSLVKEGLFGTLFCVIIIFLFLRNIRATVISILSLPISIFVTIALLNQMGYTLNIMTLGGIAVSIGRIVDDSIVVIENIYRWRQEKGKEMKGKELAYKATKEVIGAIASSTIATVVVFLPLAFVSGIIGEFFRPFSYAVVISIITSLLVSVMLIPVLGAKFFKKAKHHEEETSLQRRFEKLLRGALKRKTLSISIAFILLFGSLATIPIIGVTFLPSSSTPSAVINLELPSKSGLDQTSELSQIVEGYVKDLPGVVDYQVSIGGRGDNPFEKSSALNKAKFNVTFTDKTKIDELLNQIEKELPTIVNTAVPETQIEIKEGAEAAGPPSGNGVDVNLYSNQPNELATAAKQIEQLMRQNGDLKEVTNNLTDVTPKWVLSLNQTGIDANISSFLVMQVVNEQLRPVNVGTYTLDGKELAINLSYKQTIGSKEQLENIAIPTAMGIKKLGDIADVTESTAPNSINHEDGKNYAKVSALVKGSDTAKVTGEVQKAIDGLSLPSGVEVKFGGGLQMINEGFASIGIAIGSAICLVFLVMSMTFGGIRTPLVIMSSLLFVPVGALGGLLITGQALSMSVMIGVLMLVGIVVTNAVVLLDRVEKNRKTGMEVTEAIIEAAKIRLRPILMTACATILALVPLAFSSSSSSSLISSGLAITVIGGLFTSTLLTLIVLPVIYQITSKRRKVKEEEVFE
ncbi:efflux RND transporter permease subunit [Cohnella abietis]|uniref:Swarming motility protein SwrC n=1 Tax=Cohnella abietis TaxID=2507935 RepID=A0A3T1D2M3_9BACL|nr:efflux RND transporter permease subunit [Cohnella abietis]BBI32298.1 swarming motility protein SwrC [Cohnella abietis]